MKRLGAQAICDILQQQEVEYIFGLPGGANMPIFDALLDCPIRLIKTRHEQGATHMGDGYARATGKPGVVLVTSGPGATNAITGIMTAHMDSSPMVVICGQVVRQNLGLEAFQEADVFGISLPVVKHSYLIKNPQDIPRIFREAFHLAATGRPGPIVIDIPKDVQLAEIDVDTTATAVDIPGYRVPQHGDSELIAQAAKALTKAQRPLLLVGQGAIIADASRPLRALAEKMKIPVVNTLLGKGAFPETHELCLGMLGMHGTAYANYAVRDCDLIMSVGSRWDDRILGIPAHFCEDAYKIHVDIDQAEKNKLIRPDLFILGDARLVLEELNTMVKPGDSAAWVKQCKKWKKDFPLTYDKRSGLRAQYIMEQLDDMLAGEGIVTTDVGQHQMWAAQWIRVRDRRRWLSSGGAGTMGFGLPAGIGAALGNPDLPSWVIAGDGGFQMTMCDLTTAALHKIPVKVLIMNNHFLGMVRQWQDLFFENRLSGVDLEGNPDFVKLAEACGATGFRIKRRADVRRILEKAAACNDGPCIIDCEVEQEDNVFPMIPAGKTYDGMLLDRPTPKKQ